jgi:hypothetical protein
MNEDNRYAERERILVVTVGHDEIQFTKCENGELYVEIDEPGAGDTETGFGATTSITLSRDDVIKVLTWISREVHR